MKRLALAAIAVLAGCASESGGDASQDAVTIASSPYCASVSQLAHDGKIEAVNCGVSRGPKDDKKIAIVFTAGYFCEGGPTFLDALKAHRGKASFFMMSAAVKTTDAASKCAEVMPRLVTEGHYVGLHSDTHPDMVSAQGGNTIVTRARFDAEVTKNADLLRSRGVPSPIRYWMPPSETYNDQISAWSAEDSVRTVFMTESLQTRGDYLAANAQNGKYTAAAITSRILDVEARDPKGLNGAILFLHLGVGTARSDADKFHHAFPGLLDELAAKGYSFVRIDELLDPVMGTTH